MAMASKKDQPTYYNIIGEQSKSVIAIASGSKVLKVRAQLQKDYSEKLIVVPQE